MCIMCMPMSRNPLTCLVWDVIIQLFQEISRGQADIRHYDSAPLLIAMCILALFNCNFRHMLSLVCSTTSTLHMQKHLSMCHRSNPLHQRQREIEAWAAGRNKWMKKKCKLRPPIHLIHYNTSSLSLRAPFHCFVFLPACGHAEKFISF